MKRLHLIYFSVPHTFILAYISLQKVDIKHIYKMNIIINLLKSIIHLNMIALFCQVYLQIKMLHTKSHLVLVQ